MGTNFIIDDATGIVKAAEQAIQATKRKGEVRRGKENKIEMVTTTQLRRFLTAVNAVTGKVDLYQVQHPNEEELSYELQAEIQYLKVKLVYQIGREKSSKDKKSKVEIFAEEAKLISEIDHIGSSVERYNNFAKYVEALIAFHKFYGGKD